MRTLLLKFDEDSKQMLVYVLRFILEHTSFYIIIESKLNNKQNVNTKLVMIEKTFHAAG